MGPWYTSGKVTYRICGQDTIAILEYKRPMFPCEFYEISGYVTLLAVDHLLNVETQLTNSGVMEVQSWRHFLESFRALCRQNYHSTVSVVRSPSLAVSVARSGEQDHP